MPVSRSDHGAAPVNGSLYVAGGMSACLNVKGNNVCNISDVSVYTPETKSWKNIAPMNVARRGLGLAADEDKGLIYAVGGMDCKSNCYGLPVEYLNTGVGHTERCHFHNHESHLPYPQPPISNFHSRRRKALTNTYLNNNNYFVNYFPFNVVEVLDINTGVWTVLPPMPTGRRDIGVAVVDSKLYVMGGCGGDGKVLDYQNCEALSVVEMYDPAQGKWSTLSNLLSPRHGFATGVFGTQIVVAGGTKASGIDAEHAKTALNPSVDSYDSIGNYVHRLLLFRTDDVTSTPFVPRSMP